MCEYAISELDFKNHEEAKNCFKISVIKISRLLKKKTRKKKK